VFIAKIAGLAAPSANLAPGTLDFGKQLVGATSAAQTATLTNAGDAPLTITNRGLTGTHSGDFAQTDTGGTSLDGGADCTASVTFTPTATGGRSAMLTIEHDALGSPHKVQLSRIGTDFSLSGDPTSRKINAGQSTTYTLSVNPVSGFNQTVALSCTGAPQRSSCQLSPNSTTPDGTNPAQVTVSIVTTKRSMVTPRIHILPLGGQVRHAVPLLMMLLMLLVSAAVRRQRRWLALACALLVVLAWAACGGGGGGGADPATQSGDTQRHLYADADGYCG